VVGFPVAFDTEDISAPVGGAHPQIDAKRAGTDLGIVFEAQRVSQGLPYLDLELGFLDTYLSKMFSEPAGQIESTPEDGLGLLALSVGDALRI
jgi:hypothetical protein